MTAGRPSSLLGVEIDTAPWPELLRRIVAWAGEEDRRWVAYANAHVLNRCFESPELREAMQRCHLVYCDGHGVRLAAWLAGQPVPERMTGADWIWALAALCEREERSLFLLGSAPGAAAGAAAALTARHPLLRISGTHDGCFRPDGPESLRVLERIGEAQPDIVLVGMGTPRQELWVDRHRDRIEGRVVWTVGALFDYLSGRVPRAPRWMSDSGLEWLFRLLVEPGRMWRRYVLGNPIFLWRVRREAGRAAKGGGRAP